MKNLFPISGKIFQELEEAKAKAKRNPTLENENLVKILRKKYWSTFDWELNKRIEETIPKEKMSLQAGGYTLEEVGMVLGCTRERARQLESQALRKLKHPGVIKGLYQYKEGK